MKRIHIHVGVKNIDEAVRFYSALFGAAPVKIRHDYAKWMLDDPRVNFAISTRAVSGVDHLGIQTEDDGELAEIRRRVEAAHLGVFDEGETVCCYAKSDKSWVQDPSGVAWEAYRTMQDAQVFSFSKASDAACCADRDPCREPATKPAGCCE
jgi:catechol 2,3-dioxygenase-like lactoylglutathione lyase family enzyme